MSTSSPTPLVDFPGIPTTTIKLGGLRHDHHPNHFNHRRAGVYIVAGLAILENVAERWMTNKVKGKSK
jgi:hypothetical protein